METEALQTVIDRLERGDPPPPTSGMFGGVPHPEESRLVILPVPWDATTSYGSGTSQAPQAMIPASHQLDLEDGYFERPYRAGISMVPVERQVIARNEKARRHARRVIDRGLFDDKDTEDLAIVNEESRWLNEWTYRAAREHFAADRFVGVLGGDHSCPLGLLQAVSDFHPEFGVLHLDAHFDLRERYEGLEHSHASIMNNVLSGLPQVTRMTQVGIRDYARAERDRAAAEGDRQRSFTASMLRHRKYSGVPWKRVCQEIVETLPQKVYVSFDIDALDPPYCPNTGTPVPGGLSFAEAIFLIEELAASGRTLVGFDLCEVAPDPNGGEWDLNVGCRILYKLCGALLYSQNHIGRIDQEKDPTGGGSS